MHARSEPAPSSQANGYEYLHRNSLALMAFEGTEEFPADTPDKTPSVQEKLIRQSKIDLGLEKEAAAPVPALPTPMELVKQRGGDLLLAWLEVHALSEPERAVVGGGWAGQLQLATCAMGTACRCSPSASNCIACSGMTHVL